jgi:hypothetical protein
MSIAVSALVAPSRTFRFLIAGAGLALLAAACAVALAGPACYLLAPLSALAPAFAGALLLATAARSPKTHQIDISGTGELRVTVQQGLRPAGYEAGQAALLLPGSVVWPVLMLLRCRVAASGTSSRILVIHVWRDAVDQDSWRALAVALAVAGRRAGLDQGCGTIR